MSSISWYIYLEVSFVSGNEFAIIGFRPLLIAHNEKLGMAFMQKFYYEFLRSANKTDDKLSKIIVGKKLNCLCFFKAWSWIQEWINTWYIVSLLADLCIKIGKVMHASRFSPYTLKQWEIWILKTLKSYISTSIGGRRLQLTPTCAPKTSPSDRLLCKAIDYL